MGELKVHCILSFVYGGNHRPRHCVRRAYSGVYVNLRSFLRLLICIRNRNFFCSSFLPIKAKYFRLSGFGVSHYNFFAGDLTTKFAISASLAGFLIFFEETFTKNSGFGFDDKIPKSFSNRINQKESRKNGLFLILFRVNLHPKNFCIFIFHKNVSIDILSYILIHPNATGLIAPRWQDHRSLYNNSAPYPRLRINGDRHFSRRFPVKFQGNDQKDNKYRFGSDRHRLHSLPSPIRAAQSLWQALLPNGSAKVLHP